MSLGADTQTHTHTQTDARTKAISGNQARAAKGRAPGLKTISHACYWLLMPLGQTHTYTNICKQMQFQGMRYMPGLKSNSRKLWQ